MPDPIPQPDNPPAVVPTPVPLKPTSAPVKIREPKHNFSSTQGLLSRLQELTGTPVISYYNSARSSMVQSHPDLFLDQLHQIGHKKTLSLVLVSYGGEGHAALRIASILRHYCEFLNVLVPSRAASAATMLCLAADKIIMSPSGFLSAIDSSLRHGLNPKGPDNKPVTVSVDQVKRVLKFLSDEGPSKIDGTVSEGAYRTLFKYLHPLALGEIDRASSNSTLIATKIMNLHPDIFGSSEKISYLADHLVNGYPAHGFPILYQEAREIGLPVEMADEQLSDLLRDLVRSYDVATLPATTHFSETFYRFTGYPDIIESSGRRISYRYSYNKRFNPVSREWLTENDLSQWINFLPGPGGKIQIQALDVPAPPAAAPLS